MIRVTDSIILGDHEVEEHFVRSTGARGQNVRNEATAVELRMDLRKSMLPLEVRERLFLLAGRHVTRAGVLVVVSRAGRSQAENRRTARARLVALLKRAAAPVKTRKATKVLPVSREKLLASKHQHSAVKQVRTGRGDLPPLRPI